MHQERKSFLLNMVGKRLNSTRGDIVVGLRMSRLVSWAMVITLLMNVFAVAFFVHPARAAGTIYIRPDGSIDPPASPIQRDGDIYTFTDSINDSIVVERDNIIIHGAGYTLQGTEDYGSRGIYLAGRSNVTIKDTNIKNFGRGLLLYRSSNNSICGNNITANSGHGI